jgi:two-component system response regulator FixJ
MGHKRLVHIVDDDEAVRDATKFFLNTADYDIQTHDSGTSFIRRLGDTPDLTRHACVLLDIHMPGLSGLDVQAMLKGLDAPWPVIILTGQADIGTAIKAMKNGAFDFFEKPFDSTSLLETLDHAFGQLEETRDQNLRAAKAHAAIARLTNREREVMGGLLAALPNKLIAYELDISVRTVEVYRAKVMEKLDARGLSDAIRVAIAAGLQPMTERRTN